MLDPALYQHGQRKPKPPSSPSQPHTLTSSYPQKPPVLKALNLFTGYRNSLFGTVGVLRRLESAVGGNEKYFGEGDEKVNYQWVFCISIA